MDGSAMPSSPDLTLIVWNERESLACDGAPIFLLRDNVQHYLERGTPSGRFPTLHALADSFWSERVVHVEASQLRSEIFAAWDGTWQLPAANSAVSLATSAAYSGSAAPPRMNGSATSWSARRAVLQAMDQTKTIGQLVANVVGELMALSWMCSPGEAIRVATPRILGLDSPVRGARAVQN